MGLQANDIVAVTYQGEYCAQQIRNTFHYRLLSPGNSANPESDLLAIAQHFASSLTCVLTSKMLDAQVSTMAWHGVAAQRVYPTRTIKMVHQTNFSGIVGGDGLPSNSAIVITKRTRTAGRAGIGSLHMSGVPLMWIVNGSNTNALPYQDVANAMLQIEAVTPINTTMEPGLFNPTTPPIFFSRLFDALPQTQVRTMRRRTVGLGI